MGHSRALLARGGDGVGGCQPRRRVWLKTRGSEQQYLINIDGLPLPRHFVGRKRELRQLRQALADNRTKSAFIRGMGGMGKSSLAAKLAQRPGTELDGMLVIRCHEVDVLDIPGKLASFLQSQGVAGHADAGNLLLNPTLDPAERAQRAAQLVPTGAT